MRPSIVAAAVVAAGLIAPSAQAALPTLSLERADRAASTEIDRYAAAWNEWFDPALPIGWIADDPEDPEAGYFNTAIVLTELDACEHNGRAQAECDVTYRLNDGQRCDDTIIVKTTRSDRLRVQALGEVCDSDL